jgi:prepilin-type N-terminal cleavage/methylation domain-containing protein
MIQSALTLICSCRSRTLAKIRRPKAWRPRLARGFTLVELLISMAILGEIAAFTIPKVLSTQQNSQKKLVFRETLATLAGLAYQGYIMNEMTTTYNGKYFLDHVNATKVCYGSAQGEGCFPQGDVYGESGQPGFVMHNGATLGGFEDNTGGSNGFVVDWNGAAGPNLMGDDQMVVVYYYISIPASGQRGGTIIGGGWDAPSAALYKQIFDN